MVVVTVHGQQKKGKGKSCPWKCTGHSSCADVYIEDPYDDDGDDDDYYRCRNNGCDYRSVCKKTNWTAIIIAIVAVCICCIIIAIVQVMRERMKEEPERAQKAEEDKQKRCEQQQAVAAMNARLAQIEVPQPPVPVAVTPDQAVLRRQWFEGTYFG